MEKIIKASTKRGQQLIARAKIWEGNSIFDVYHRPSYEKLNAERRCRELEHQFNGWGFHICSHNTFGFSAAFAFEGEDGNTCWVLVTKDNTYVIK